MTEKDHVDLVLAQWGAMKPTLDVSDMGVTNRLFRLQRQAEKAILAAFRQHGLHAGEFDVLASLYRAGAPHELTPGRLLDALVLSSGAMTHRLDQLEHKGWIARRPDPDDRRGVRVALTATGLQVLEQTLPDYLAALDGLLAPLDAVQRGALADLLRTLALGPDAASAGRTE